MNTKDIRLFCIREAQKHIDVATSSLEDGTDDSLVMSDLSAAIGYLADALSATIPATTIPAYVVQKAEWELVANGIVSSDTIAFEEDLYDLIDKQ